VGASEPTDLVHAGDQRVAAFLRDALCAVDASPGSIAAVEQAAALAGRGGHLTLLEVTSFRSLGDHRAPAVNAMEAKRILDSAVAIAKHSGVSSTVEVDPAAPPWRVILEWAAKHAFLAMGSPSTSWFGGLFLGGAADHALGELTAPLLVARPVPGGGDFDGHIVIASDGLDGSDELVDFAAQLARTRGLEVTLGHALTPLERHARRERVQAQATRLESVLDAACAPHMQTASPPKVIIELARATQASMVVMGARGLHGIRAIGSVSRRVAHEGPCSVMLVPHESLQR
jgi:nucleotide-binding universal stress UspA family protein